MTIQFKLIAQKLSKCEQEFRSAHPTLYQGLTAFLRNEEEKEEEEGSISDLEKISLLRPLDENNKIISEYLVLKLYFGNNNEKEKAVTALHGLTDDEGDGAELPDNQTNKEAIRDAGGITALIKYLEECPKKALPNVNGALSNLVEDNQANQNSIAHGLVELLSNSSNQAKENAAYQLSDLVYDDSTLKAIVQAGGIKPLVKLLKPTPGVDPTSQVNIQAYVCNALKQLADANQANQNAIGAEGGINTLVNLLKVTNNKVVQEGAAFAISALVDNNKTNQNALVKEGGVDTLISILNDAHSSNPMDNRGVIYALVDLSKGNKSDQDEIEKKVANKIKTFLQTKFPDLYSNSALVDHFHLEEQPEEPATKRQRT